MSIALDRLLDWYQNLSPASVDRVSEFYTKDAYFKDPFNEFKSREDIRQTYLHMFRTLDNPRFFIEKTVTEGRQSFAIWHMEFSLNGKCMRIRGCSHFEFNADGLVQSHRDYWDAAEEFYEKLPVLGMVLRVIKRRVKTPTTQG